MKKTAKVKANKAPKKSVIVKSTTASRTAVNVQIRPAKKKGMQIL